MRFFSKLDKKIKKYVYDTTRDVKERSFVLLSIIALFAMVIALIVGMVSGQPGSSTFYSAIGILVFFIIIAYALVFNRIKAAMIIISTFLVFIYLPVTFFGSGGIYGGTPVWFAFATFYIVMILDKKPRLFFLVCETVVTVICWYIGFKKPELISTYSERVAYTDSFASLLIVGLIMTILIGFQTRLYRMERERAEAKTKEIEEINLSQSRFFSSMSHEIRTPINSIMGLNELILREENIPDSIKRDAANIEGAGKLLLALVNDILDISKIEAGKMDIVPVNYDVSSLVSEIINMVWQRAEEKGLELKLHVDPSLPAELFGDEVRVRQILINLLNNAVKYTSEGSITLHIECEKIKEEQALILFSVSDTGMGIKKDALPHLFDVFQRVDLEKNRNIEGTGLGLSIVKQLVELMGGKVTVNSVYTQGSTFTVTLWQGISSKEHIGTINIRDIGNDYDLSGWECSFKAPEARILIVDDNDMNLDVEARLLAETDMIIDTVLSGGEALIKTSTVNYDLILMDHLMPVMDGIECLKLIRKQTGGLNNSVPVIVLTANAGSENRQLYNVSGFDDYLVKPVSGKQLEETLLRYLPAEKVSRTDSIESGQGEVNTANYNRKQPVLIATGSMCDLPAAMIKEMRLDIIPFTVMTDGGMFEDSVEAGSDELVNYMKAGGKNLRSDPPTVEEFEAFFAKLLKRAHQVIYIAVTSGMSSEYVRAHTASRTFENVTVIDSECLSSSLGLLVMSAYQMSRQSMSVEKIISELNEIKKRIHCSFIIERTEYMRSTGFIGKKTHMLMKNMALKPSLIIKDNRFGLDRIWRGSTKRCYEKYIRHALPKFSDPDKDIIFVTYVDIPENDLLWIEEEIRKRANFDNIIFQKASASISLNCGPGTFGLLYMDKGEYSYKLSSLISGEKRDKDIQAERSDVAMKSLSDISENVLKKPREEKWYTGIDCIDINTALKNSGSEDILKTVVKVFYDTIDIKYSELCGLFTNENWKDYTIKIHGLKSSAKLCGALRLSLEAEKLESAGEKGDIEYIRKNHEKTMDMYKDFKTLLLPYVMKLVDRSPMGEKPLADDMFLESAYEALISGASSMDYDMIEEAFKEIDEYRIPDAEKEKLTKLRQCFENFDYDGILELLGYMDE